MIGVSSIVLATDINRCGKTLIEKFEANANVGFVVVLLTLMTRAEKSALLFRNERGRTLFLSGVISLAALVVKMYVPYEEQCRANIRHSKNCLEAV